MLGPALCISIEIQPRGERGTVVSACATPRSGAITVPRRGTRAGLEGLRSRIWPPRRGLLGLAHGANGPSRRPAKMCPIINIRPEERFFAGCRKVTLMGRADVCWRRQPLSRPSTHRARKKRQHRNALARTSDALGRRRAAGSKLSGCGRNCCRIAVIRVVRRLARLGAQSWPRHPLAAAGNRATPR